VPVGRELRAVQSDSLFRAHRAGSFCLALAAPGIGKAVSGLGISHDTSSFSRDQRLDAVALACGTNDAHAVVARSGNCCLWANYLFYFAKNCHRRRLTVKMIYRILTVLLLLSASALAQNAPTLDETAHFLAGMPVTGVLEPLTHDPAWQEHAQAMNEAWTRKERQQIWPIRQWMQANAPQYHRSNDTVFYMFGGPDFLYASIFFPLSSNYVLAGLEPIGNVPDLAQVPPEMLRADLISLRNSMNSILRFQYFITKEMRADLGRGNVGGTLPILYVFLARLGYTIVDVTHVTTPAEGVKITFSGGEQPQTLYYFKTDLAGGGNSAFLRWGAARGPGLSLLKAASFLMHGDGFSGVRNFLLQNSRVIIQDDSGIPLRAFSKGWKVN